MIVAEAVSLATPLGDIAFLGTTLGNVVSGASIIYGTGVFIHGATTVNPSWMSVTYQHINNPSVQKVFWIEYYVYDNGIMEIYTVLTHRPSLLLDD